MIAFPLAWLNAVESASQAVRDWAWGNLAPTRDLPEGAEFVFLPDGTRGIVYPLPRTAGAALAAGLAELSPASRYQRFLSSRERFTSAELEFLTNCDGTNHLALVLAVLPSPGKRAVPVAVARSVRDLCEPDLAEMAIAVADRWQGRGAGQTLIRALQERVWKTGVRRWRAFLFAENRAMWRLLEGVGELDTRRYDGPGCVEANYTLDPPAPAQLKLAETPHRFPLTAPQSNDLLPGKIPASTIWVGVPATAILVTGCALWWKKGRRASGRSHPNPETTVATH